MASTQERIPEFFGPEASAEATAVHERPLASFPGLSVRIEDLFGEADRVVVRLTFTGTHRGRFRRIEPTGRRASFGAIRIYRLTGGLLTETWAEQDVIGLLAQLQG